MKKQIDKEKAWISAAQRAGQIIALGILGWWAGMLAWYQPGLGAGLLLPLILLDHIEIIFLIWLATTIGVACYNIKTHENSNEHSRMGDEIRR